MEWKQSLDKYLTTEPDDGFSDWVEELIDKHITEYFYKENEEWLDEPNGLCNIWLNKLFNKGFEPIKAAEILERAYNLHFKK